MAFLADDVLDAACDYIGDNTENLYITDDTAAPDNFTKASSTYKCGVKAGPSFTGPANGEVSGRKITCDAISDGTISATATAKYFALTDDSESLLILYEELDSTQSVTNGNTFSLTAFDVEFPDAA